MYSEGDIVLIRYPNTDGTRGKRRPAVLLKAVGNSFGGWIVCMVSTQLQQCIEGLEVVITSKESDVSATGLRADSLLRTSRLAVVSESIFELELGTLSPQRLREVKERLASWFVGLGSPSLGRLWQSSVVRILRRRRFLLRVPRTVTGDWLKVKKWEPEFALQTWTA
jgi:mRNA interferase MazF